MTLEIELKSKASRGQTAFRINHCSLKYDAK